MELQDTILITVTALGFISLCKQTYGLLKWVWITFLRPPKNLKERYGSWAIVTGSTDGIGKAIAMELAAKGLNLVLVGRNPSKLAATASEIRLRFGGRVGVKNIAVDFAGGGGGGEVLKAIGEGIKGLDVGVLVNNAGVSYPRAMFLDEAEEALTEEVVKVNVEAATWVMKAVIPAMLEKGRGAVVNMGSGSSVVIPSFPLFSVYAATKAYVAVLSRCINLEYKSYGIDIQCQIPLFVATNMTRMKKLPFLVASPEMYAKASLRLIGYDPICTPLWSHSLQWSLLNLLPNTLVDWCNFQVALLMRKRGLSREGLLHK